MKSTSRLLFACSIFLTQFSFAQTNPETSRQYLLTGVRQVGTPGTPGPLVLTQPAAFPIMMGSIGGNAQATIIAGSTMGRGRIVAFGQGGYLSESSTWTFDTPRLLSNSAYWVSRSQNPKIITRYIPQMATLLRKNGITVTENNGQPFSLEMLRSYDALIVDPERLSDAELAVVKQAVNEGLGLMVGGLGWGWKQLNPGKSLPMMKGNILLREAGIQWIDGYLQEETLTAKNLEGIYLSFNEALQIVRSIRFDDPGNKRKYGQALSTVMDMLPHNKNQAPFAIYNDFPGQVNSQTPRVTKRISIDTKVPTWHSTGLYAPPGELITLTTTNQLAGYGIRIGAHSDKIYHKKEPWKRHPELSLRFEISDNTMRVFNPFGGLIYIEVPPGQSGIAQLTISGAIEAPYFKLGETSVQDWNSKLKNLQAPWAELEGEQLIITLQSSTIRNLTNPTQVVQFWDRVQENNRLLANWPANKGRPMRIVFDLQISAGYMHSGYPIMSMITPTGEQEAMLNVNGDHWGFYHELGHNHQHPDWTFDGTVEVTCNLFTLYNREYIQGLGRAFIGETPQKGQEKIQAYFQKGSPFEEWKKDPFLALHMYNQLIDAYGWQTLMRVIQSYSQLEENQRPKTNQAKMDLWMVSFSQTVGQNLSGFFARWGVPITRNAQSKVSQLPPADLNRLLMAPR